MQSGVAGFLVDSVEEAAERIPFPLNPSQEAEAIAREGWARVRERLLMPRLLLEELKLVQSLVGPGKEALATVENR